MDCILANVRYTQFACLVYSTHNFVESRYQSNPLEDKAGGYLELELTHDCPIPDPWVDAL